MISQLLPVCILAVFVLIFGFGLLFLTSLVGPKLKSSYAKRMPYECGVVGESSATTKISVKFYLVAILFILFDIEVVFLYPWAIVYRDLLDGTGAFIFVEMIVFMFVLIIGFIYAWRAKGLEWE